MIITPPENKAVTLGEIATFTCIAIPNIIWTQIVDGNTLLISRDIDMIETGNTVNSTLTIREDNFGSYQCIAGNNVSSDVANFMLYKAGKQKVSVF